MAIKKKKPAHSSNGNRRRNGASASKSPLLAKDAKSFDSAQGKNGAPAPSKAKDSSLRTYSIPDLRLEHPNFTVRQATEKDKDGEHVRYLGPVDASARAEVLGGAYALLHLIGFDEPFGYSVVEAMAGGTPVIANSRGSMGELIAHGVTGFLVEDIDSAVAAVAAAGDLDRRRIAELAAERFTVATMIDKYVKVYRDVIADRK